MERDDPFHGYESKEGAKVDVVTGMREDSIAGNAMQAIRWRKSNDRRLGCTGQEGCSTRTQLIIWERNNGMVIGLVAQGKKACQRCFFGETM